MKEIVRKLSTLILFELPLQHDYISAQFTSKHNIYLQQYPHWSLASTRKKIIANYWFSQVQFHLIVLIIAVIVGLPFADWHWPLQSVFFAGLVSFIILAAVTYWPTFLLGISYQSSMP